MQEVRSPTLRFPRLSFETYAAITAAVIALIGVIIQRSKTTPISPKSDSTIETVLYQAAARRLLAEAIQQSQTQGTGCYGRGADCALTRMRRDAIGQLKTAYTYDPNTALNAYTRLKTLDAVSSLQASPEATTIEQFLTTQRRTVK